MPKIGDIKKASEINYRGTSCFIWRDCQMCGKERWVRILPKGIIKSPHCISCAGKAKRYKNRGSNSYNWKGGRLTDYYGYTKVWVSHDSFFYPMIDGKGYIAEHRLVMARHLGRCLLSWELVHHINGVKDDNRIENLELSSRGGHITSHAKGYRDGYLKGLRDGRLKRIRELEAEIKELRNTFSSFQRKDRPDKGEGDEE